MHICIHACTLISSMCNHIEHIVHTLYSIYIIFLTSTHHYGYVPCISYLLYVTLALYIQCIIIM